MNIRKNFFIIIFTMLLGKDLFSQKLNFTQSDYKLINFLIHESFDIKTIKVTDSSKDSVLMKAFTNAFQYKFNKLYIRQLSTKEKLAEKQEFKCDSIREFNNELSQYFKENKRDCRLELDSLNKYVDGYEIEFTDKKFIDPMIFFDKPLTFYVGNRLFYLISYYYWKSRSNGEKDLYLVEKISEDKFRIVCRKILLVH